MTKRLATMLLATMFLVGVNCQAVRADDSRVSRATLKGVDALYVLVEGLSDRAKTLGLTEEAIQTDVELKLGLAGMRVVASEEGMRLPGSPVVYVNINVVGGVAANIDVQFQQNAQLERNSLFTPQVPTWSTSILVSNPTAQGIP